MIGNKAADSATSTSTSEATCQVFSFDRYANQEPHAPLGFMSIDDLAKKWEKDDKRKSELESARKWIANEVIADEETIKSYRLKNGWSQVKLADMLNTSQSHVARIEKGTENLTIQTCRKLCHVLNIDMNKLDVLLGNQENILNGASE